MKTKFTQEFSHSSDSFKIEFILNGDISTSELDKQFKIIGNSEGLRDIHRNMEGFLRGTSMRLSKLTIAIEKNNENDSQR